MSSEVLFSCSDCKSFSVSSLCPESTWVTTLPSRWMKATKTERPGSETTTTRRRMTTTALTWKSEMIPPVQASHSDASWPVQRRFAVFQQNVIRIPALCFVCAEEKADPSIPLYVLPLYSLLAPEKQAKVRLLSYVSTKPSDAREGRMREQDG